MAIMVLLAIPVTIFVGMTYLQDQKYLFISLLVMIECMIPFFLVFEGRHPKARELVIISVLCAIAVAGRLAFTMLPQFKPVVAIVIISGVAFGGESGFLVGAVSMLVSNLMFGQGPWTPWQMFAAGIIGFVGGILFTLLLLYPALEEPTFVERKPDTHAEDIFIHHVRLQSFYTDKLSTDTKYGTRTGNRQTETGSYTIFT